MDDSSQMMKLRLLRRFLQHRFDNSRLIRAVDVGQEESTYDSAFEASFAGISKTSASTVSISQHHATPLSIMYALPY